MPYISIPFQFKRQEPAAFDIDSVFTTTSERTAYLTNAARYAGQIVADLQTEKVYMLNAARNSWLEVGSGGGGGGAGTVTKATSSIGNGSSTSITFTHNLNSSALNVSVWDNDTKDLVFTYIQIVNLNTIKLEFNDAPALNQYNVVVTA